MNNGHTAWSEDEHTGAREMENTGQWAAGADEYNLVF